MSAEPVPVLVTSPIGDEQADRIRAVSPRVQLEVAASLPHAQVGAHLAAHPDIEVLFARSVPDPWEPGGRLRWVQTASAGVDGLQDKAMWRHPEIMLTSMNGIHGPTISEWVFAMMLHHAHRLGEAMRVKETREWPDAAALGGRQSTLLGRVLGIVGYGSIGRECARLGRAVGMRVMATSRSAGKDPGSERERFVPSAVAHRLAMDDRVELVALEEMDRLLSAADYLVLSAPATPETRQIIGPREFGLMKPTAFLVNVARGALVNEEGLVDALREGRLGGAALDVFEREPLPPESLLFDLPNVLMTPHVAGSFDGYWEMATEAFCQNLERYLSGRPLLNVVDRGRSY